MFRYSLLYYITLYCITLYYITIVHSILYSTILFYIISYCIVVIIYHILLYYTISYYIVLCCIIVCYIALFCCIYIIYIYILKMHPVFIGTPTVIGGTVFFFWEPNQMEDVACMYIYYSRQNFSELSRLWTCLICFVHPGPRFRMSVWLMVLDSRS